MNRTVERNLREILAQEYDAKGLYSKANVIRSGVELWDKYEIALKAMVRAYEEGIRALTTGERQ